MLLFNILDLNIVPINFHALQREIPFVNLMNYSHTFDHLVKETIGIEFKNKPLTDIHGSVPNDIKSPNGDFNNSPMEHTYTDSDYMAVHQPEDQLVRYLMYPLGFRRLREYVNHVYKIMAGVTSLSLNRPKYLSDQLWNKVLLNNLYNNKYGEVKNNLNQARRVAELEQVNVDMSNRNKGLLAIFQLLKIIHDNESKGGGNPSVQEMSGFLDAFGVISTNSYQLNELDKSNLILEEIIGVNIVRDAIKEPFRQILINAGSKDESYSYMQTIMESKTNNGFDAYKMTYVEDMIQQGIIDPLKVVKSSLSQASSASSVLLTTEVVISEVVFKD
jgi:hypothetical protein